jgi:hypothetical protein
MNPIPSIFVLSAAAAIIAVVGFFIVHRVIKPIDLNEHQGFLDASLSIVGTLVSILLGLLVAAAMDHYHSIEQSVDAEASYVSEVYRLTSGLPEDTQKKIRKLCVDYCQQVVNDEWPAMEKGESSHAVLLTYVKLVSTVVTFHPSNDGENNLHAALLSAAQQIGDGRRQRILALNSVWTKHLMPVLVMCSTIVLGFAYLYVRRGAVLHAVLICFVAVALGGNLGLVFLLSSPFSGDWKIQPRGFELNMQLLREIKSSPELKSVLQQK